MAIDPNKIALWVLTPNGMALAAEMSRQWPQPTIYCSQRLAEAGRHLSAEPFERLVAKVAERFNQFDGHIFFTATGIAVRSIGPLLKSKSLDPAVVVVDDRSTFAISLVSGHIGGANRLAVKVAELLGATPVITTATDINDRPAIDLLAVELGLIIENPQTIKKVNMALLDGRSISLFDPYGILKDALGEQAQLVDAEALSAIRPEEPVVCVDDRSVMLPDNVLVLRPRSLCAGVGCNRNTSEKEIHSFLQNVLGDNGLSMKSLRTLASIAVKTDEVGMLAVAETLAIPLKFYSRQELNQIQHVPNPSHMVAKHVGVQSVCEAAAILAAQEGQLIVPKQKTANVTVAIARRSFSSSASAREA